MTFVLITACIRLSAKTRYTVLYKKSTLCYRTTLVFCFFFNKDAKQRLKEIVGYFLVFNKSTLILFIVLNRTIKYSVLQSMTFIAQIGFFKYLFFIFL